MNKLVFQKIEIQNFLSIGPKITLELHNQGIVGVFGSNSNSSGSNSNGAGKTTCYGESIVWCLFGDTLRGLSADAVVHRKVGKDCFVSLFIQEGINEYEITRTRKMSNTKKPNDVCVYLNGQNITKGKNEDTQELINSIIGMDKNTFIQSVLLSYGIEPFSRMTDKQQKEIFEDILQLQKLSVTKDLISKELSNTTKKVAALTIELDGLKRLFENHETTEQRLTKLAGEWEESLRKHKKSLDDRIESFKDKIRANNVELINISDKRLELANLRSEIDKKSKTLDLFKTESFKLEKALAIEKANIKSNILQANAELKGLNLESNRIAMKGGSNCDDCKQFVSHTHIDKLLQDVELKSNELEKKKLALSNKYNELDEKLIKVQETRDIEVSKAIDKINEAQMRSDKLNKEILLKEHLIQENNALSRGLETLEQEREQIDNEVNECLVTLEQEKVAKKTVRAQMNDIDHNLLGLANEERYLGVLYDAFGNGGIKSYVINSVLPFFQAKTQYYADILSDGELVIELSTQKELKKGGTKNEFTIHAYNKNGADVYAGNSAGEKQRIDLAIGWALGDLAASRANKPISLKICDEVFTHTDNTGIDNVVKLLKAMTEEYDSIFCITHDSHLAQHFEKTVYVQKKDGFTSIMENN